MTTTTLTEDLHDNSVEWLGHYGSDLTHAASAWTSTVRDLTPERLERVPTFLAGLARDGHETPFEKSALHFLCTTDIATHIHIIKHRIANSVNTESARYKELKEDRFFLPHDWPAVWRDRLAAHTADSQALYHECIADLTKNHGFSRKRAKETARYFLQYNTQLTQDVMMNCRSFHHFLKLRVKDGHAQLEIERAGRAMLRMVMATGDFTHTGAAFGWDRMLEGGCLGEP